MFGSELPLSELAGGAALGAFLAGIVLASADREADSRILLSLAWGAAAIFWVTMIPTFLAMRSLVEPVLALAAVPVCLAAARSLLRGHDGVALLTRAVGTAGVLYAIALVPLIEGTLIETVATHTEAGIRALGYDVVRQHSAVNGFDAEFVFTDADGHRYVTFIVLACTGIGAMSIFTGLVAAVSAPLGRKLRALAVIVGCIWLLNVGRNVFIAVAFGDQWFQSQLSIELARAVGYSDPAMASYFVADRLLSQSLSVVVILALAVVLVRLLPETTQLLEAVLHVLTGREYRLDPDSLTLTRRDDR